MENIEFDRKNLLMIFIVSLTLLLFGCAPSYKLQDSEGPPEPSGSVIPCSQYISEAFEAREGSSLTEELINKHIVGYLLRSELAITTDPEMANELLKTYY